MKKDGKLSNEQNIEIKLTKKQYRELAELVYLGNWMVNAMRTGTPGDETIRKYEDLEQLIYSFAKIADLKRYIEYDHEFRKFFPTADFEEGELEQFREDYDEETFWQELEFRLSRRDFIRHYGEDCVNSMSLEERLDKEQPFIDRYADELENYGIDNLEIIKRAKA